MIELYLAGALLLLGAVCVILWQSRAAVVKERDAAQAALAAQKVNEKVVTKYVDRIVEVEKRVPVVAGNLERLCKSASVPGPRSPDATAAPDAGVRPTLDAIANDVTACQANSAQLQALQDVLREQVK